MEVVAIVVLKQEHKLEEFLLQILVKFEWILMVEFL